MELAKTAAENQSDFLIFPIMSMKLSLMLSDLSSADIVPATFWKILVNISIIQTFLSSLFLIGPTSATLLLSVYPECRDCQGI